jgi:tetratricopeptide (TPR) repeat protein
MDHQKRLAHLLALHKQDPADAFTRYGIALEYQALQNHAEALQWFLALRNDTPEYVPTYYMLAGLYRALGQDTDAKKTYAEGITIARRTGDSHAVHELQEALEELEDEADDMMDDE